MGGRQSATRDQGEGAPDPDSDRVLLAALAGVKRSLAKPWLAANFDPKKATAAVLDAGAADLPATAAELTATMHVLNEAEPTERGVLCQLAAATATAQKRLGAVEAALQQRRHHQQQLQHGDQHCDSRSRVERASAQAEVLSDASLLTCIVSFIGRGDHLFVASTSRILRGAYMSATATEHGLPWVCATWPGAAVNSPARLELALACGAEGDLAKAAATTDFRFEAGLSGSWEVVERLQRLGMRVDEHVLYGAAWSAQVGLLARVHECVAEGGVIALRHWQEVGLNLAWVGAEPPAFTWLAQRLLSTPHRWPVWYTTGLCYYAACGGHLATLQFLRGGDGGQRLFGPLVDPTDADLCTPAYADVPAGMLLIDAHGRALLAQPAVAAAASGNLHMLERLRSQACELRDVVADRAAFRGRVAALRWLEAQRCPLNINTIYAESMRGTEALPAQLEWVRSRGGGDWSPDGMSHMLADALQNPTGTTARWLREQGAPWPDGLALFVLRVPLDTLVWAVQGGCAWGDFWDPTLCRQVCRGRPRIRRLLHELGCPCRCPRS